MLAIERHHEKFVWNFGAGGVMDAVFKTEHMPSNEAEEPNGTSTSITKPKKSWVWWQMHCSQTRACRVYLSIIKFIIENN